MIFRRDNQQKFARRRLVARLVATFSKRFFCSRARKAGRANLLHNGRSRRGSREV